MRASNEQLTDTQDMGLSVALICAGYELVDLESQAAGKRVTFRFKTMSGIDQVAQNYWAGKLSVDAKTYWNETKNLKTRLYSL